MVILYLTAIVSANLLVAHLGPSIAVFNAFAFIGLDITTRDALHDRWSGTHLRRNMATLILAGSLLSYALNANAARIALASCLSFAGAATIDTLVYSLLGRCAHIVRVNGSNVVSGAVDSVLFPALAFGFPLLYGVMAGQFIAKVFGGYLWSVILAATGQWGHARRDAVETSG